MTFKSLNYTFECINEFNILKYFEGHLNYSNLTTIICLLKTYIMLKTNNQTKHQKNPKSLTFKLLQKIIKPKII